MGCGFDEMTRRIKDEGIVAIVRGDFPAHKILEIGDALLAAPLPVMEVTISSSAHARCAVRGNLRAVPSPGLQLRDSSCRREFDAGHPFF